VRPARIRQVIGAAPPDETVAGILGRLGFPVVSQGQALEVEVPSFRRDVTLEDDLVEEVVRVWGYDRIPSTLPSGTLALTRRPRSLEALTAIRRTLAAAGYQEAVTLSMVDPERVPLMGLAREDPRVVALRNPLAADRSVLRPTLLLGLLEAAATNVRHQAADVRLFEVGRVFEGRGPEVQPREETRVAVVLTGLRAPRSWFAGGGRADVFDVKGAVESAVEALGRGPVTVEPLHAAHLEEGRGARVRVGEAEVGSFGELAPAVQAAFGLAGPVYVAELSIDALESLSGRQLRHRSLPRFPGIQRDLAVVLPAEVPAADVERTIRAAASSALKRAILFDVYTGDPVPAGQKSLAFGLFYQADERTLTDPEVNAMHREVVEHVRARLGAEVRGDDARGAS
jgi:phenylalanyl-tRNA synthetase beta chain